MPGSSVIAGARAPIGRLSGALARWAMCCRLGVAALCGGGGQGDAMVVRSLPAAR